MNALTLLCIGDRPQMLGLCKTFLESNGYRVKIALSVPTVLQSLQEEPVSAVVLEYKTEGMDAQAIARHVKQRFPKIPIILLSACVCKPGELLWLVDEVVMRSELSERLVLAIQLAIGHAQTDEIRKPAPHAKAI